MGELIGSFVCSLVTTELEEESSGDGAPMSRGDRMHPASEAAECAPHALDSRAFQPVIGSEDDTGGHKPPPPPPAARGARRRTGAGRQFTEAQVGRGPGGTAEGEGAPPDPVPQSPARAPDERAPVADGVSGR
ncbi:hypothetical protein HPB48_015551 [Haemaphysalis longicornis]|uniref:Uncharacterized protein n=1 Tax=Haemaphysalis longicornis TaxID=44386 RepID=A0A9J6FI90_HAELO|nr:hypothetical protein HPB48_015551 [Haemaphysalis longicornis]